ncbi:MAG: type 1 glutamine amidotransferase [Tepidisphaerales bacterium]
MSKAIILQNVEHEGPGRIVPVFRDFGIPTEVRRLYSGDEVPSPQGPGLEEIRLLVVLGGPMGVSDVGSASYPFLAPTLELLKVMVARDRPVLGICLGAQLLAAAGGARVYRNVKPSPPPPPAKEGEPPPPPPPPPEPLPEFGWHPVTFPFPGGTEPIVMGLVDGTPMFHWHFDTFDLPKLPAPPNPPPGPPPPTGSVLLSSSKLCRNQAFRFKTKLFGFQYHFEFTPDDIERVVAADRATAVQVLGEDGVARIAEETKKHYARHERAGNKILTNLVQFLKSYQG